MTSPGTTEVGEIRGEIELCGVGGRRVRGPCLTDLSDLAHDQIHALLPIPTLDPRQRQRQSAGSDEAGERTDDDDTERQLADSLDRVGRIALSLRGHRLICGGIG